MWKSSIYLYLLYASTLLSSLKLVSNLLFLFFLTTVKIPAMTITEPITQVIYK